MSLLPHFLGLIVIIAVALFESNVVSAQETTNFAAWKDPKNVQAIPGWVRRMLVRDFRDLNGDLRQQRLDEYFAELKNIVMDTNVAFPTRYNAIVAIGQLVSTEGTPESLPIGYPAALTYLVEVYQQADAPAFLKYGALVGIVRHAYCGINETKRDNVIELLFQTVTAENGGYTMIQNDDFTPPLEPGVWNWFRQTALDGLSALKTTGTDGKVVKELLAVMNQQSQKLEEMGQDKNLAKRDEREQLRQQIEWTSKVAKTLGDLNYQTPENIDAQAMTNAFLRLMQTVCDIEQKIIVNALEKKNTAIETSALTKQIAIDLKTCSQSIAWGIRGSFLSGKPAEHSFYVSQTEDEQAIKRLESLWKVLSELSVFLDEGNRMNQQPKSTLAGENTETNATTKEFKFNLSELQEALAKFSETLKTLWNPRDE